MDGKECLTCREAGWPAVKFVRCAVNLSGVRLIGSEVISLENVIRKVK